MRNSDGGVDMRKASFAMEYYFYFTGFGFTGKAFCGSVAAADMPE